MLRLLLPLNSSPYRCSCKWSAKALCAFILVRLIVDAWSWKTFRPGQIDDLRAPKQTGQWTLGISFFFFDFIEEFSDCPLDSAFGDVGFRLGVTFGVDGDCHFLGMMFSGKFALLNEMWSSSQSFMIKFINLEWWYCPSILLFITSSLSQIFF